MTRAVYITSGGDPLLGSFCIELLRKYCWDEFDSLYIGYNNYAETPKDVQGEFLSRYLDNPKIKIIYWPTSLGYGGANQKMLQMANEDLVLLLEDDGFIFTKGKIKECFDRIESGEVDALGSPRFSCGLEIAEALKVKYNLDYSGYGDKGPNFWPNFFFCKRSDLLKTDMNFDPKSFSKGVYYPELDHTMNQDESGDTFVWACIQMRHQGVRFGEIPQFHASPFEISEKEKGEGNWINEKPYWIHGGSLSVNKYLKGVLPDVSTDISKQEIESRCAWWDIVCRTVEGFDAFRKEYIKGLEDLVENCQLDKSRIYKKRQIYKELIK